MSIFLWTCLHFFVSVSTIFHLELFRRCSIFFIFFIWLLTLYSAGSWFANWTGYKLLCCVIICTYSLRAKISFCSFCEQPGVYFSRILCYILYRGNSRSIATRWIRCTITTNKIKLTKEHTVIVLAYMNLKSDYI
jgi:hypothetical protein